MKKKIIKVLEIAKTQDLQRGNFDLKVACGFVALAFTLAIGPIGGFAIGLVCGAITDL